MMAQSFTVYGIQGKQRPRFFKGHAVTPKETVQYEKQIANAYKEKCEKFPSGTPLEVTILVRYDIPKSYTKKRVLAIMNGKELPIKKPDIDNIAKIILDGLNGVAYDDDTQVTDLHINKRYMDDYIVPREAQVYVIVEEKKNV